MGATDQVKSTSWDDNRVFVVRISPYFWRRTRTASRFKYGKTLEIGCGVTPIDDKSTLVELCTNAVQYLSSQGRSPIRGNAKKLSFKSDTFDTVFMLEVLEHVDDYEAALKEIFRVLKTGGKLVLSVPVYERKRNYIDEVWGHKHRFDPDLLSKKLAQIGFSVERRQVLIGPSFTLIKRIIASNLTLMQNCYENCNRLNHFNGFISMLMWPLYPLICLESALTPKSLADDMLFVARK